MALSRYSIAGLGLLALFASAIPSACSGDAEIVEGTGGKKGDSSIDVLACSQGQFICDGDVAKECLGGGKFGDTTDCKKDGKICVDFFGCVTCAPISQSCKDGIAQICRDDGSGYDTFECDPLQG